MQKQQTVAIPATPPPPAKPAPLVVTQTVAQLPDPQPVPPDSIPPRPPVEYQPPPKETDTAVELTLDPKTVKTPARTNRPAAKHIAAAPATTATEPPAPEPVPPPVTQPVTPPVEEQPPAPPKLSAADESAVSKDQVNAVLSDVQKILKDLAKHKQSTANQEAVKRIRSFVRVAQQAINRDDLRQGDIVAHRALALARDLTAPK